MKSIQSPFILFSSSAILASVMMMSAAVYATDITQGTLWSAVPNYQQRAVSGSFALMPDKYTLYTLDESGMQSRLTTAARGEISDADTLSVPLPDGSMLALKLSKNSVMSPEFSAKFPEIKTFDATAVGRPGVTGVIGTGDAGFHGMLFDENGKRIFIDRRESGGSSYYISYYDADYNPADKKHSHCDVEGHDHSKDGELGSLSKFAQRTGATHRNYRLAMAVTGEYTAFHGGTKPGAIAAIVTTVARVNVIYKRDLDVDMTLVANNDNIVYTDAATDPYDNATLGTSAGLASNQTNIDTVIQTANYDVGHVMSTGGGGLAQYASVCDAAGKARAMTAFSAPVGDPFDIDYVAHELGHQFSGSHSYNADNGGSCTTRVQALAFEPGGGTTIMAYAGICGTTQDVQQNSDAMFHVKSIEEMGRFIDDPAGGASCGVATSTGNNQPTANAGVDYTIPTGTPFELVGTGTDADAADALTYSWEQADAGTASDADVDTGNNAILRTFLPKTTPNRTIPQLTDVLAGTQTKGEILPVNPRTLNFALAVRDQKGAVGISAMKVNVVAGGPFAITSHTTTASLAAGTSTTVTWNVANTTAAPVSCPNVNILMSTDGGATFPTTLLANTLNDGSESVTIPAATAANSTTRFKVACANNIFFNVSRANLTITAAAAATPNGAVAITGTAQVGQTLTATVTDTDGAAGTITYQWLAGGVNIAGATGKTYVLTASEVGKTITVKATYADDKGTAESPTSAATTAVIAATPAAPTGTVTITGTPQVGQTLTATVTDTNGAVTGAIAYQWLANGVPIAGATGKTYVLTANEVGKTISVTATYANNSGVAQSPTSTTTVAVTISPTNIPVFGPFGLLASLLGLLWLGARRRKG